MNTKKNIGFISTRLAGTDGVSLEAAKWAEVLEEVGHRCFWFAGELDHDPSASLFVPEAHFQDEHNQQISQAVFGHKARPRQITDLIHELRGLLRSRLHVFIQQFELVKELKDPRCKLVISHAAGDEGLDYSEWLQDQAHKEGIDLRFLEATAAETGPDNRRTQFRHYSYAVLRKRLNGLMLNIFGMER
ncbi:MAG: hypothetical protein JJV98_09990 [Desulfosarcina sp.]|nr:hypothetical protein [Desulfobacterales bacterium]